jgi:PAS domain S-box-containing protein
MAQTKQVTVPPARSVAPDPRGPGTRPTGIDVVGDAPWGTHFCQLYATKDDLAEILVPYFKAGLESDERCLWITSPPLDADAAWSALASAVPDLESYRRRGRIEIIPHTEWCLLGGRFERERVLAGWVSKHDDALALGCAGLRLSGDMSWLERSDWRNFAGYEAATDGIFGRHRILALCTFSLERCGAPEIADVIGNHQFALIKRDGRWERFESFDRRRMQHDLAVERERLAVTVQSIADGVIATDTQGRVTMLNRVAEALTGWSQGEASGRPVEEIFRIVVARTGAPADDPVRKVLDLGSVAALPDKAELVSRDGRRIAIAVSVAPIRGHGDTILGAVLVFRDVTAQRRADAALRDSEERVRLKLESILLPEGDIGRLELADVIDAPALQALMDGFYKLTRIPMAVIALEGEVLVGVGWQTICTQFHRVHPETCRYCIESDTQLTAGVPAGEFRLYRCKNNMWDIATPLIVGGHHVGNVFMGQFFFDDEQLDYDRFRAQAKQYGFAEESYLAALEAVPRLSRETVDVAMAFFLGFAAMLSKLSYGNIALARTNAEREALMSSLRLSKEQLEEADRRKDEFLGMLSHELRNPLAPIRNSVYILEHTAPVSEQAARARAVIRRQTEHLTRIVDDLLDVTRIARGKIELRRERLDLREVVRRTAEDFRAVIENRGVTFRVEVPDEELWADADPTRLAQVIGNLLQNAAKFTQRGDVVTLALRAGEGAEIIVRDTGAGIDAKLLADIFQPFVQGERTLARTEGGLGLGLALVKGITELHGGRVRVESAGIGEGAEFVVCLPVVGPATQDALAKAARRAGAGRRVLIVDDNHDAADSMAEVVEMLGHAADVAYDGPTGIEKARANPPDFVLCDIGLPGMSGYELARALRAEAKRAHLVAVTGYAQPEDLKAAFEAGFDHHLAKPTSVDDIEELLGDGAETIAGAADRGPSVPPPRRP